MLKLIFEFRTSDGRWHAIEDLFTSGERRLAVEQARKMLTAKNCRHVRLYDFTEKGGEVVKISPPRLDLPHLHDGEVVSVKRTFVPVAEVVDLRRLPKKATQRRKVVRATVAHFGMKPAKIQRLQPV